MTDVPRRILLQQAALVALAGTGAAPAGTARAAGHPSGDVRVVADREAMASLKPQPGELVYLAEAGREGVFRCVADRDVSVADPLQGLSVACRRPGLHFRRVWDGRCGLPEWFGARPEDDAFDCADAIEACYRLCPVTRLGPGDYFIRRGLHFAQSVRTVEGVGACDHPAPFRHERELWRCPSCRIPDARGGSGRRGAVGLPFPRLHVNA